MAALFFVAESMTYRTGANIDHGFAECDGSIEANRAAAEEFSVECSCCKVFATEIESLIVDEALQVFGGYGFTEEFPIAHIYRDARVSRIYEGTNEINRIFIADRLSRRIREGRISSIASEESYISGLLKQALKREVQSQVEAAAISDLVILTYAEQSARLRASAYPGQLNPLYEWILPWLNLKGAQAFQTLSGDPVTLPSPPKVSFSEIAERVYQTKAPLVGKTST
jgi:hypothetical protein